VNSAVTGARRFGGAAAITDRKPFTVSTATLAMRSASSYESVGFLPERLARTPLADVFGCEATRNFDGGIAEDEIGWPSLRALVRSISDSANSVER